MTSSRTTIFITGGSLGARIINEAIASQMDILLSHNIQLLWQCGQTYYEQYRKYDNNYCKTFGFLKNIQDAYAASDIIVTRAGGAIFEMFVVGKPIIVLPSPNVAEDHQTKNAMALQASNAALMIKDIDATRDLVPTIISLIQDPSKMTQMAQAMQSLAKPYAATEIATHIIDIIHQNASPKK